MSRGRGFLLLPGGELWTLSGMDVQEQWMGWTLKTGRTKFWRWVKRVMVIVTLSLLVAAGVLYFTISAVPPGYAPQRLSQVQKKQAAQQFVEKAVPLHNAPAGDLVRWLASEDELNKYLASMDEIASYRLGGKRGQIYRKLAESKLSGLAVRLSKGLITLMFRSDKYGKIVSVDFALEITPDQRLRAGLKQVRIGKLRIPDSTFRERLIRLKMSLGLSEPVRDPHEGKTRRPTDDMVKIIGAMVAAIDEAPTRIEHKINNKLLRLIGIEAEQGRLTLVFQSLPIEKVTGTTTTQSQE